VPNLAPIISLFGAVFFSILGLLCPAIIHLATFWEHTDYSGISDDGVNDDDDDNVLNVQDEIKGRRVMSQWTVFKDVTIVIVALVALFSGAYTSLVDIIKFYSIGGEGIHNNLTISPTSNMAQGS